MSGITSMTTCHQGYKSVVPPRGAAGNSHWLVWETS